MSYYNNVRIIALYNVVLALSRPVLDQTSSLDILSNIKNNVGYKL